MPKGPKEWSPRTGRRFREDMRSRWEALERLPSLKAIREALKPVPRSILLEMLQWNDPNGCYLDHLARVEGFPPMTKEKAEEYVVWTINEGAWDSDDPRREELKQP